jgi:hypothetical protein
MRTTTVVRNPIDLSSLTDPADQAFAYNMQLAKTQTVLADFKAAHGVTDYNRISQITGDQGQIATVRSWPDLETAQAWVDSVLAGSMSEGLEHYAEIVSATVDPE